MWGINQQFFALDRFIEKQLKNGVEPHVATREFYKETARCYMRLIKFLPESLVHILKTFLLHKKPEVIKI